LAMGLASLMFPQPAESRTFCVDSSDALNQALETASFNREDDEVRIVRGLYAGTFVYVTPNNDSIAILGGYNADCGSRIPAPEATVLERVSSSPALVIGFYNGAGGGDVTIDGLTLQNSVGYAGAGVYIEGSLPATSVLRVSNSHFKSADGAGSALLIEHDGAVVSLLGNSISDGTRGVYIAALDATLTSNVFNGIDGPAASVVSDTATFTGNTFADNTDHGAYVFASTATFDSNSFTGNGDTGAYVSADTVHMTNNYFLDNVGFYGGGAYVEALSLSMRNNQFSGNDALLGGGIYTDAATATLTNNTFSANTASQFGGGVYQTGMSTGNAGVDIAAALYNNLFWANSADVAVDFWIANGMTGNAETNPVQLVNNSFDQRATMGYHLDTPFPIPASNVDAIDPQFVDSGNNNLHLQPDSPMIDAGDNGAPALATSDIDGEPRIQGAAVDIGADEVSLLDLDSTEPLPSIYANNARWSLVIPQGSRLEIDVALRAGALSGHDADWWVAARTSAGQWSSYLYPSGDWINVGGSEAKLVATYQGPLVDLPQFPVLDTSEWAPGQYTVYFGFDPEMNGVLDLSDAYYDGVEITIE